jgi:hypothetical protein
METETTSYQAALNFADAVIRYCLPQWVPSLGTMLCAATMAASLLFNSSLFKTTRESNPEAIQSE